MNARRFYRNVFAILLFCSPLPAFAQIATSTSLQANPTSVSPGGSATLVATVAVPQGNAPATGQVQFLLNGNIFSAATLSGGTASITGSSAGIAPGTYNVVAKYLGSSTCSGSQSSAVAVTVKRYATTTTEMVIPEAVASGAIATVSASVATASGHALTGGVTFLANGTAFASAPLKNGTASVSATSAGLPRGSYSVVAQYNGDAYNGVSDSAATSVVLTNASVVTFSVSPSLIQIGSAATLNVSVAGGDGKGTATGTVGIYDGALLTTLTLHNGSASLNVPTTGYAPGAYTLTAKYSGDANYPPASTTATADLEGTTGAFAIAPNGAAMTPGAATQFSVTPSTANTVTWYVNGVAGGSSTIGTIDASGNYTAPSNASPLAVQITATESSNPYAYASAVPVYVVVPGAVSNSNNPQVANYNLAAPTGGQYSVEFGLDTTYGKATWQQPTTGTTQDMQVAGMIGSETYHMRGDVDFGNGIVFHDADHTFNSVNIFPPPVPIITLTQGASIQPGIEVVDPAGMRFFVYDMQGNMIYGGKFPAGSQSPGFFQPVKMLPNGHFLLQETPENAFPVDGTALQPGTIISIFETELDGTVVKQLTIGELNTNLAASGYKDGQGNVPTLYDMHHDVTVNPVTGHWLLIANTTRQELVQGTEEAELGDLIIDVDPNNNFQVDWVWNEFDHLDTSRHQLGFQDWTHSNAIVYSADDHNILVSSRGQSWVMKVEYNDGAGDGTLIWKLGYQGDFTLVNGTDPQDWQYAQHEPSFTTSNTTGVFGLTLMDNGDSRVTGPGFVCPNSSNPCEYSRAPFFTIDENAMTATLDYIMPDEDYSNFGGNSEVLANGDPHVDFCQVTNPANGDGRALVREYSPDSDHHLLWQLEMPAANNAYRSHRWGSFYPGVTWQ